MAPHVNFLEYIKCELASELGFVIINSTKTMIFIQFTRPFGLGFNPRYLKNYLLVEILLSRQLTADLGFKPSQRIPFRRRELF